MRGVTLVATILLLLCCLSWAQDKGITTNNIAISGLEQSQSTQFQGDNQVIGHTPSGFPILKNPKGDLLFPVLESEGKEDVVRWMKMNEQFQHAVIRSLDKDGWPIFETPHGDLIYMDVRKNNQSQSDALEPNPDPAFQTLGKMDLKAGNDEPREPPFSEKLFRTEGTIYSPTCFIPEGFDRCAPHFLIAGAMKSGTTSLFSYLHNHPNILPLVPDAKLNGKPVLANKEVRFFNEPTFSSLVYKHNQTVALREYMKVFPSISPGSKVITGESSPMYICQPDMAPRINLMFPYIKNIILLRNPIDRMYSEHWFKITLLHRTTLEQPKEIDEYSNLFEACTRQEMSIYERCGLLDAMEGMDDMDPDALHGVLVEAERCYLKTARLLKRISPDDARCTDPENAFYGLCKPKLTRPTDIRPFPLICNDHGLRNSLYALQLHEWVHEFPEDRLLIIPSEEFYSHTADTLTRVVDFLGVQEREPFDWTYIATKAYNIQNVEKQDSTFLRGLTIGGHEVESLKQKYPPISAEFRKELEVFFAPMNRVLYRLIGKPAFWDYQS